MSTAPISPTAFTPPARTDTARQGTVWVGPTVRLGIICVEPPQGQTFRRHHYTQPEPARRNRSESTVTCQREPTPSNRPKPGNCTVKSLLLRTVKRRSSCPNPKPVYRPITSLYCHTIKKPFSRRHVKNQCSHCSQSICTDLHTDLEKGTEIPMVLAARDFRMIRDYAQARVPILPPSPAPQPRSPPPSPPPPPVQSSRTSIPLRSWKQLIQLMREITEHLAQSQQYEVNVQYPPLPPPGELSHTSVPYPSSEQLTQLMQEITEYCMQPRPR
ncbi:hypothetical protein K440DRAFT_635696 [Wilcoxina mikolae CBS 423.85]|nr:hypothetical protein K440DRAFT_635696 [Wilcoxina mikolae CBS 423.85]